MPPKFNIILDSMQIIVAAAEMLQRLPVMVSGVSFLELAWLGPLVLDISIMSSIIH